MLHIETVEPHTLSILKRLMSIAALTDFYLVGGTALSLQYGHRTSVDLDLFCTKKFENKMIVEAMKVEFGAAFQYEGGAERFGVFCFIENVKLDIVRIPQSIVFETLLEDDIRMYNPKEIAAMKIQVILGRGKKKDFWDLAELLQHFTLKEIIDFDQKKYPDQQLLISIPQAITYFTDAEESEEPISLKGQTWESVKNVIQQKVSEYLQ